MDNPDLECAYFESYETAIFGFNGFIGKSLQNSFGEFRVMQPSNLPRLKSILHMATRPDISFENLLGQLELDRAILRLAESHACKLIYTSSNNVYGNGVFGVHDKLMPSNIYGYSKSSAEMLFSTFYSHNTTILRIADVFGRGQRHGNFFRNLEGKSKMPEPLKIYGSGKKIRSVIWIDDLVQVIDQFLNPSVQLASKIYNVGYVQAISIKEIADFYDAFFHVHSFHDLNLEEDDSVRVMSIEETFSILDKPIKTSFADYFGSLIENV